MPKLRPLLTEIGALAGIRTRVSTLARSYGNCYTTNAETSRQSAELVETKKNITCAPLTRWWIGRPAAFPERGPDCSSDLKHKLYALTKYEEWQGRQQLFSLFFRFFILVAFCVFRKHLRRQ